MNFNRRNQNPFSNKTNKTNIITKTNITNKKISLDKIFITIGIIIIVALIIYIIICYINFNQAICHEQKSFFNYIFDFYDSNPCIHETDPTPPPPSPKPVAKSNSFNILPIIDKKEVFHIANQDYTYDQAKCKCESYGSRLATKDEVTEAYNNGANWCTYGWVNNQSAYYPVQKCTWDKMQEDNKQLPKYARKFCGRNPGLNGGYFTNPSLKFGVNCFGVKPKGKIIKEKKAECAAQNFCELKSNFQAANKLETDEIVGFNEDTWKQET
jgi:hypothetical protein